MTPDELRAARAMLGFRNQQGLADALGISKKVVSEQETIKPAADGTPAQIKQVYALAVTALLNERGMK